ncbi:MAG: ABC transporter ATP-binding protein [Anaerolineae bacterium]|jgi:lipopolysaccharide transport system ATP-binding protein|nr:ABC transporter ATP-binding protein [Anaerolineae bacterium]
MTTAIRFDHVSKKFILRRERARSFQELALNLLHRRGNGRREEFWALRDVSFEIAPGETVGVIGPNGAGKSTALKLISRIIEPTSGNIEVNGRIGALLELGAGFHPDLTGRENIYLNGSILGLSRTEIRRKLDDIIGFAELERFIDVPVKHYSSGMYMRLGFSVAAHTDPQILLVDEVLAVGDAAFQRKCLERINDLRRQGVTVLFVSHSVDTVRSLCNRVLWLNEGHLVADDSAEAVVQRYLEHSWGREGDAGPGGDEHRWGSGKIRIVRVRLLDGEGRERQQFRTGEPLGVEMQYRAERRVERPVFGLAIHRSDGVHITGPNSRFAGLDILAVEGEGTVTYTIPTLSLLEGLYHISVSAHNWGDTEMYDYHDRMYSFWVLPGEGERYGVVTLRGEWSWNGMDMS